MRIAYPDPHPVPDSAPEALQILQTAEALARLGHRVELITPRPEGEADPAAVLGRPASDSLRLVHVADLRKRWWMPGRSSRGFQMQAAAWLRRNPVDALLVRNLKLADALLRDPACPPLFFETHEIFAQTFREEHPRPDLRRRHKLRTLESREARVYGRSRGLVVLTALLAQDVRSHYVTAVPIHVAPDGVDLAGAGAAAAAARTPNSVPVALYVGSLHPWKGVDTLVRAAALGGGWELRVAGGDAKRIAELSALARSLGVGDRVHLIGPVAPAERFALIGRADVCLLPLTRTSIASRYTSPLKLFEYMAMGRPIVVADLPSIREVVRDGEHALLVPPEEPAAIAAAVNRLAADPALRERLGRAAAALAASYSWERRAEGIAAFMAAELAAPAAPVRRT
jgi:glycosyltransferase involved in cell wall biosynthesis